MATRKPAAIVENKYVIWFKEFKVWFWAQSLNLDVSDKPASLKFWLKVNTWNSLIDLLNVVEKQIKIINFPQYIIS